MRNTRKFRDGLKGTSKKLVLKWFLSETISVLLQHELKTNAL